jgi:ubiquinone/menaquinone biosynthesis C-methylase UbiE
MWEKYYSTLKRMPNRLKETAKFVAEALPTFKDKNVKTVLDLGCGTGRHCVYLAKRGFNTVGLDVSKSALRIANEWVRKEKLTNVTFVQATMTNLPFCTCCFGAVVSVSVVHHGVKRDILKTVSEIHRILNKKGVFLVNLASVEDPRYGTGQKVEDNTFQILEAFEDKRFEELHHFFTRNEISEMLTSFVSVEVRLQAEEPRYWEIMAVK